MEREIKCLENAGTQGKSDLMMVLVNTVMVMKNASKRNSEIKQTGFKNDKETLDKLVAVGADSVASMVMLWIVFSLGTISFINILAQMEYGVIPCPGGGKIDLTAPCKLLTNINLTNRLFAKKNKVDGDRFKNDHESFAVCCTLLVHDALIVVFGILAWNAHDVIRKECYGVESALYGGESALDSRQRDAFKFETLKHFEVPPRFARLSKLLILR